MVSVAVTRQVFAGPNAVLSCMCVWLRSARVGVLCFEGVFGQPSALGSEPLCMCAFACAGQVGLVCVREPFEALRALLVSCSAARPLGLSRVPLQCKPESPEKSNILSAQDVCL